MLEQYGTDGTPRGIKKMRKYFEQGELSPDLWHYATCQPAAIGMRMLLKPTAAADPAAPERAVRLPPGTERKEAWHTLAIALRRTRYKHLSKTGAAKAFIADAEDYVNGGAYRRNLAVDREPAREPEQSIHRIMMLHSYDGNHIPSLATLKRLF